MIYNYIDNFILYFIINPLNSNLFKNLMHYIYLIINHNFNYYNIYYIINMLNHDITFILNLQSK